MLNKRSLSMILLGIGVIGFLVLYYASQAHDSRHSEAPYVQDGVIDLTDWEFDQNTTVRLNGNWQFYWNQLLASGEIGQPSEYLQVPGQWNRQGFPVKGAATYRLLVKVKPSSMIYGLRISNVQMSSAVYVNGAELGHSGTTALNRDGYVPENKPYTIYFPLEGDTAEIILHAANFDFINAGVTYSIHFGSMDAIQKLDKQRMGMDLIVVIALLMIGIYHLGVYLKRKQERSLMYFGLFCMVVGVALACLGDKLFAQIFDKLPFELIAKIQIVAIYGSMILIISFIRNIFSDIISIWFYRLIVFAFGAFIIFSMIMPYRVFTHVTFIFSAVQVVVYAYIIWMLSVAREDRYSNFSRQSIVLLILAFYALPICLIDNSLYMLGQLPNNYLGTISMMIFAILVSLMLSFRFSDAYKTIEGMSSKLVESDRLKDEFLINTSHELQTPLNGILNISQSMLEHADGNISEKERMNLSIIQESAKKLSTLVEDILDLERIKRNDLRLEPAAVDVQVTVSVVLELLNHLVAGKELRLINRIPDGLPPVRADEYRLRQVFYNLIGNAIKFTEQGHIEVAAVQLGKQMKVTVRDTGIGIDPADWPRMFDSFTQAEQGKLQGYGGVGLGLSISRQLVEMMNGRIYIESSELGHGTSVTFLLPLSEDVPANGRFVRTGEESLPIPRRIAEADSQNSAGDFTLLLVDDEPTNLQVLLNLFAEESYNLLTASNGREALRMLQNNKDVDLVLLDVMMPQLSGYEVCRTIRDTYTLFDLPVVMMTVRNTPHDIATGFTAGANDFIVKPFNAWEVRARVKTLLELKKSVRNALDAEMAFLQSQIKPHFLFNALNAILSICYTNSSRAAELITHLSYYLRRSIDIPGTDMFISLREEVKLVQSYVEIEKARFDERLKMDYDIDDTLLDNWILPLMIQPLVENAIRHGIMRRKHGGKVRLIIRREPGHSKTASEEDVIEVQVWDNGLGIPPQRLAGLLSGAPGGPANGVGLINIHRRLLGLQDEGLRLESKEGEWTCVRFRIKTSGKISEIARRGAISDAEGRIGG